MGNEVCCHSKYGNYIVVKCKRFDKFLFTWNVPTCYLMCLEVVFGAFQTHVSYVSFLLIQVYAASYRHVAVGVFADAFTHQQELLNTVVSNLCSTVDSVRLGQLTDTTQLSGLLRMFQTLDLYGPVFEETFLKSSAAFFRYVRLVMYLT